jgi:intein/homing endonuclease
MLETPKANYPEAGKVTWIYGQSAGKEDTMNKDLLYITGLLLGDGSLAVRMGDSISTSGIRRSVRFAKIDHDVVIYFKNIIENHFGGNYNIFHDKENNVYEYSNYSSDAFEYLSIMTGFKNRFPDDLKVASKEERLSFLAGLLDSDGFASLTHSPERLDKKGRVAKARDQFRMGFTNTRFIDEFHDLLDKLGIKYGTTWINAHQTDTIKGRKVGKQKTRFTVPINAMSFAEQGGFFRSKRKQDRLISYLEYQKTCYFEPHRLNAERIVGAMV